MIDHYDYQMAVRQRLLTLSLATTGSISLAATTTGYTRSSGSFLTDGFVIGMEVSATGFGQAVNNEPKTITAVTATTIECAGNVTESAAAGRVLNVSLPALRGWDNIPVTPVSGRPYVVEQYLPGGTQRETLGTFGELEVFPMYVVTFFGVANVGLAAVANYADAVLALFPPATVITASNGDVLRVRGEPGPFRGQLMQYQPGWCMVTVTIPLRGRTTNVI